MREEARMFWEQALEDLRTAEILLNEGRYYASVFFAHQAAEKALKALYIQRLRRSPPRTHSLVRLVNEMNIQDPNIIDAAMELTPEYVTTRYPDAANEVPARIYNRRIAEEHLRRAREVIEFCRRELGL